MSEQKRFIEMEQIFLDIDKQIQSFQLELDQLKNSIPQIKALSKYYGSKEWFYHYELEEQGKINYPTTSVLGQDYLFNRLEDIKEIAQEMQEIATEILKKE